MSLPYSEAFRSLHFPSNLNKIQSPFPGFTCLTPGYLFDSSPSNQPLHSLCFSHNGLLSVPRTPGTSPWGLCMYYFFCLECPSTVNPMACFLTNTFSIGLWPLERPSMTTLCKVETLPGYFLLTLTYFSQMMSHLFYPFMCLLSSPPY